MTEHVFDDAAQFKEGQLENMAIEPWGSLTPNAYTYGGLVAHGLQGTQLWASGDVGWSKLDRVTASGAGLWRGERITSDDQLDYIGITAQRVPMTIWLEGDVWLEMGTETFRLQAKDIGFVDLLKLGATGYDRVMESSNADTIKSIQVSRSDWYPIRVGFASTDRQGEPQVNFEFSRIDATQKPVPWTRARLRARASELRGTLRTVFFQQILGGGNGPIPPVPRFEENDLLAATQFNPVPQGTVNAKDWSARYVGQVYIEQPGSYTLTITSDDGNRGRLGSVIREASWLRDTGVGPSSAVTAVPAMLPSGWNDLIVDYNQVDGAQLLHVQLAGPGFDGAEAPRERLRPVESADDRLTHGSDDTNYTIVDDGRVDTAAVAVMPVVGYPGEQVVALDLSYLIESQHWGQLGVDLEAPGSPPRRVTIRSMTGLPAEGNRVVQLTIPPGTTGALGALLGGNPDGTWKLYVYDLVAGGGVSTLKTAKLTVHTAAGPARIAPTASWTSQVLPLSGDVTEIDGVTWDARVGDGSAVNVLVRTCQQATCADGAWRAAQATPLPIPRSRYLQLRVEMTSNGILEPELRALRLQHR